MDPSSAEEISARASRTPGAVAVALAIGALLTALALFSQRTPRVSTTSSTTSTSSNSSNELARRARAFVQQQVGARDVVLFGFVDSAHESAGWTHCRTLLAAVVKRRESVMTVDLAAVAQGHAILEALRELRSSAAEVETGGEGAGESGDEFLFVRGALVGDFGRVRQLLITGALEETLTRRGDYTPLECDFSTVRVDEHSDAGFIVLGPLQCFQDVQNDGVDAGLQEAESDLLVETRPLDSVDELSNVEAGAVAGKLLPRVPLAGRARNPARRSKLLVCHDMKGGYLGDRFTQGSTEFDAYRFYQWDLVDLFVYFGHHLVCIPPAGWIAAGHRNGTRVLGAVVTEGSEGAALSALIFKDRASAQMCATKLAAIAALYGFDGYLLNVENNVAEELVPNVLVFLQVLRAELRASNPEAQVIWYATLARSGKRKHQVRLDADGAPFFACVDGLFTEYGWTADDAKYSAAFDLDRRFDVYMGVDVFGRHDMLGGGKLSSGVALRAAWNAGVSAALFAPGWTHECLQHEAGEDFVVSEDRFWTRIRESWKPRSPCFSALGGRDTLYSAFNVGRGKRVWVDGESNASESNDAGESTSAWSNLLEMDQQPVASLHAGVTVQTRASKLRACLTHDTAFQGGASVSIQGSMRGKDKAYVKLFDVDIELSARHIAEISYTTAQPVDGSVALLVLTVCPGLDRAAHQFILRSEANENASSESPALSAVAGTSPGKHFYAPVWTREYASIDQRKHAWRKKAYRIGGMIWDQKHIVEIGVLCTMKKAATGDDTRTFHACIGEVCVARRASVRSKVSAGTIAAEPVRCEDARVRYFRRIDANAVAFRIEWTFSSMSEESAEPAQFVLVYLRHRSAETRRVLLGKSFGSSFHVTRCPWPQLRPAHRQLLVLELESVSWCGTRGSASNVCRLYLDGDSSFLPTTAKEVAAQ